MQTTFEGGPWDGRVTRWAGDVPAVLEVDGGRYVLEGDRYVWRG